LSGQRQLACPVDTLQTNKSISKDFMSGKSITQEQVKLYMSYRNNPKHTQVSSSAKAGFSERTARRIDSNKHQKGSQLPRQYKTRKDPFNGAFEQHLVPLLEQEPALQPITLLEALEELAPGQFDQSHLRTLQRRVKRWRAKEGPAQEVIFQQKHIAGDMGISDYTWANELNPSFDSPSCKSLIKIKSDEKNKKNPYKSISLFLKPICRAIIFK
jgi:hypothetical protein